MNAVIFLSRGAIPGHTRRRIDPAGMIPCFLLALLLAAVAPAEAAEWRGSCEIRFDGTSTLHDFSGTVRSRPFAAATSPVGGKPLIPRVTIDVPVDEMKTGNETRDRQMREMFQSDKYPLIRAFAVNVDPDSLGNNLRSGPKSNAIIDITLKIRETERRIRATAGNLKEDGGRIAFDLEFPVSLESFGLTPPTVFGIIRVKDAVKVGARVVLQPASPK
jgi:polyisoprenoid-binding protein YceI